MGRGTGDLLLSRQCGRPARGMQIRCGVGCLELEVRSYPRRVLRPVACLSCGEWPRPAGGDSRRSRLVEADLRRMSTSLRFRCAAGFALWATYFLGAQESRQRNASRFSWPFGLPSMPERPAGGFANSPCGLRQRNRIFCRSFGRLGTTEGFGALPTETLRFLQALIPALLRSVGLGTLQEWHGPTRPWDVLLC